MRLEQYIGVSLHSTAVTPTKHPLSPTDKSEARFVMPLNFIACAHSPSFARLQRRYTGRSSSSPFSASASTKPLQPLQRRGAATDLAPWLGIAVPAAAGCETCGCDADCDDAEEMRPAGCERV